MQGGIHVLIGGLVLASFFKRKELKLGIVFGALLPDFDIFIQAIVYLAAGQEASENIHRGPTHSFLIAAILAILIVSLGFIPFIKKKWNYDFLGFGIGLGFAMIVHDILDLFWLSGAQIFWPFSKEFIGFPLVPKESLSTLAAKLVTTTDLYLDIFFLYIPMIFLAYKMGVHKKLRIPYIVYSVIYFATVTFFVVWAFVRDLTPGEHEVLVYYPGTIFLVISIITPLLFRNVIREFRFDVKDISIILCLFVLAQFLFWAGAN